MPGIGAPRSLPSKPSRDHQVQHDEEIVFHGEDDPLADPPKPDHASAFDCAHRRLDRPDEERVADSQAIERLVQHTGRERTQIQLNVGEFWH